MTRLEWHDSVHHKPQRGIHGRRHRLGVDVAAVVVVVVEAEDQPLGVPSQIGRVACPRSSQLGEILECLVTFAGSMNSS